jgi:hypothetical protein
MTPTDLFAGVFGLDHTSVGVEPRNIVVIGEVVGETPGIGLWVKLATALNEDGKPVMPSIEQTTPTMLVRWEHSANARVFARNPSTAQVLGFRAR